MPYAMRYSVALLGVNGAAVLSTLAMKFEQNFVMVLYCIVCEKTLHGSIYREALPSSLRRWEDVSDRSLYF